MGQRSNIRETVGEIFFTLGDEIALTLFIPFGDDFHGKVGVWVAARGRGNVSKDDGDVGVSGRFQAGNPEAKVGPAPAQRIRPGWSRS